MEATGAPGGVSSLKNDIRQVAERTAIAAAQWIGRGQKDAGDGAAVDAMRASLTDLPIDGRVIVGEGEKDDAPFLYRGERLGSGGLETDLVADPVEGTTYLASGLRGSMATLAAAPAGAFLDPGPCFYMEKLVVGSAAASMVDPTAPVAANLSAIAKAIGKRPSEVIVFVLDKPRHTGLVNEIYAAGARVVLGSAGDLTAAILAATEGSGVDALMGTGGTPEGILSACALAGTGGAFFGRLNPQLVSEVGAVAEAGIDTTKWWDTSQIVTSSDVVFVATGITDGALVRGVGTEAARTRTDTFVTSGRSRNYEVVTSFHQVSARESV